MANLSLTPEWVLTVKQGELRLILRSLRGAELTGEEEREAEALCDRLTLQKAKQVEGFNREMQKHAEAVLRKGAADE